MAVLYINLFIFRYKYNVYKYNNKYNVYLFFLIIFLNSFFFFIKDVIARYEGMLEWIKSKHGHTGKINQR